MYIAMSSQSSLTRSMLRAGAFALLLHMPSTALGDTFLLMAEEDGCYWCGRWNEDISSIYPKTAEGQAAPLRRYNLHHEAPENVRLSGSVHYTPTFLLIQNGVEIGRIEGYPGEDFFWGLLGRLFEQADIELDPTG